jgi:predicted rRNA methylase YqxC with S4 and FtsJ domains
MNEDLWKLERKLTMSFYDAVKERSYIATRAKINEDFKLVLENEINGAVYVLSLHEIDRENLSFKGVIKKKQEEWTYANEILSDIIQFRKKERSEYVAYKKVKRKDTT